ncbi:MAG: VWA domain-containing protein [Promethearchaeota archaeon]|nr:MAG: VWA domain-containing protein [Candidatus Lokiarchaeota archaeon]
MNLANAPFFKRDEDYINYFHAISLHEVSHYEIIPYDGLMHAKLLKAAMKYVNQHFAAVIVNVFADLVVDSLLFQKYPDLMVWELKQTYHHISSKPDYKISDFSSFLFNCYERMWEIELGENKKKEVLSISAKVVNTIKEEMEDEGTWEKKVTRIASYMKDLISDTFTLIGPSGQCNSGCKKKKTPGGGQVTVEVPEDVLEIMDNPFENKNGDNLKQDNEDERRRKAEEFARDTPYSEFGAPANQAGLLKDGSPLATWYRGLAKNLIEIRIFEEKPGGQVPVNIEPWRIGDPMEELDIVQTLLTSPVIIPNITTRKWSYREGPGHLVEQQLPDLLLVLDSSGSMGWNIYGSNDKTRGPYHIALVASFAALHFAASRGAKFSIINFSNRADTCNWTADFEIAEKTLLRYQGGGTHLPIDSIKKQCNLAERNALVFVITDFGIYNWADTKDTLLELANRGHKIVGFFIGSASIPHKRFEDLLDKVIFYPIRNTKDLIHLVIEEVKKYYT